MAEENGNKAPEELIDRSALFVEEGDEGAGPPVETSDNKPAQPQLNPIEQDAFNLGWRPKNQWQGDPEDWRPAKEWLERGQIFQKMRSMSVELADTKQAMSNLYGNFVKVQQDAYRKALDDLKQERRQALRNEDFDTADKLDDQIDAAKQAITQAEHTKRQIAAAPVANPVFTDFVERNPWYKNNARMRHYADAVATELIQQYGNTIPPDALIATIEKETLDQFSTNRPTPAPSPDGSKSKGKSGETTTYASLEKSMTPTEVDIMNTLIKTKVVTKEQYMKDYAAARRGK